MQLTELFYRNFKILQVPFHPPHVFFAIFNFFLALPLLFDMLTDNQILSSVFLP